jgi:hypothetical protein
VNGFFPSPTRFESRSSGNRQTLDQESFVAAFPHHVLGVLRSLGQFPFKVIVAVLNIVPVRVYELHGPKGVSDRPEFRELPSTIASSRKLHLGSVIVAWQRGDIVKRPVLGGGFVRGVYRENFEAIQNKWTF